MSKTSRRPSRAQRRAEARRTQKDAAAHSRWGEGGAALAARLRAAITKTWVVVSITATALAFLVLWPRVTIALVSDADPSVWLYAVRNDGLLPIYNVQKATRAEILPASGAEFLKDFITSTDGCSEETAPIIAPTDEHTFRCFAPQPKKPSLLIRGTTRIDVTYSYMSIFRRTTSACFEWVPTRDDVPRWLRRACQK